MATSSTSPATTTVASLTAPPTFTGVSNYGSSLQQVLSRAVSIASLPLQGDQATLNTLTSRQTAVQSLDTAFTNLQQSVTSLQDTLDSGLLSPSVSNSGVVTATVSAGASTGTYSILVNDLGSNSTALSVAGDTPVTDPTSQGISSSPTLTLTAGGITTTLTPASSSLDDLETAINAEASGQVQATIVNVGSTGSPDYRLSLQATALGTDPITLTDASANNLIANSTNGALASYEVDGSGDTITSISPTVTLAPGLSVTLTGQSAADEPTTISVSQNASNVASSFSAFAGSYNAAVTSLAQYHGQNGGVLEGDSLVQTLTDVLNQLGNYSSGSAANALANYGVTLDDSGNLDVDTNALASAAYANFTGFLTTLGTSGSATTTGSGFLGTATNLLNGLEDPTTGIIKNEETQLTNEISTQQTTITNAQAQVTQVQTSLTQQISLADSTIASLESQVSFVTGLFAQYTGATNTQQNGLQTL